MRKPTLRAHTKTATKVKWAKYKQTPKLEVGKEKIKTSEKQ